MNGISLCTGHGGIELGLHLALGEHYRTVCYVERDAYAAAALVARMEDKALDCAPIWDDLKSFDGGRWRGCVDIVSGGYPCQPFSVAGKQLGADDPRHLWPDVFRIWRAVGARYLFCENVAAHIGLGFDAVLRDLHGVGARVAAGIFSAEEVGAPHLRERLFFLAELADCAGGGQRADGRAPGRGGHAEQRDGEVEHTEREPGDAEHELQPDGQGGVAGGACGRVGDAECARRAKADGRPLDTGRKSIAGRGPMADARDGLVSQPGRGAQGRNGAGSAGAVLSDASGARCEGREWGGAFGQWDGQEALGSTAELHLPLFPPGPGDADGWRAVLAAAPEVKPAVCRVVDGMAPALDRLRGCGNGVVPLVAAKAFVCLTADLEGGREIRIGGGLNG